MHRLFVAIDLPDEQRQLISSICFGLENARWVKPEQIHLTLRFIGEVDGAMFRHISETLAGIKGKPFELQVKGIGHFPPRRTPKVLWLGISANNELARLRQRIESALTRAGLEPERRKFSPHVTIARFKNPPPFKRLAGYMAANSLFEAPCCTIDSFHLYSSHLSPKGAQHRIEYTYELGT